MLGLVIGKQGVTRESCLCHMGKVILCNLFPGAQEDKGFFIITNVHEHRAHVKFNIVKWVGRSEHI